ncbi:DUF4250 domain-containing protein [Celerinatantimonas sp. YJH-8]|uniref:DUF4250 domain-containing protein n=1 Tax=Celerinatantimonas sp. YJH-8 TaxID=3228714 RepID=UPI0038C583B1
MDPILLMSMLNMKLRDESGNLNVLCRKYDLEPELIIQHLKKINYYYHDDVKQFNQIPISAES